MIKNNVKNFDTSKIKCESNNRKKSQDDKKPLNTLNEHDVSDENSSYIRTFDSIKQTAMLKISAISKNP